MLAPFHCGLLLGYLKAGALGNRVEPDEMSCKVPELFAKIKTISRDINLS